MEFKRINKDTVTCIITEDDMDEQGIKLEDLFEKKKEAIDFLHDVMRKAEEEVDYKPSGSFMPLQITVLPDHSISLTLSENSAASFGEMLKNLTEKAGINIPKDVLEDIGDSVDEERINRLNDYLKSLKNLTNSVKNIMKSADILNDDTNNGAVPLNINGSAEKSKKIADSISNGATRKKKQIPDEEELRRLKFHEFVFSFTGIGEVITFCAKAPRDLAISSSLYKNADNRKYYLVLTRENEEPKKFASLFTMAYEFGQLHCTNPHAVAHIRESFECIVKENALENLASTFA